MTTLIEPFIFNRVSADIKRFIAGEQQQAISDDAGHFVPDESVPREDFYEDLHVHFSFLDLLLTVRFNEHASLDKAANLGISRYIKGYASLLTGWRKKRRSSLISRRVMSWPIQKKARPILKVWPIRT